MTEIEYLKRKLLLKDQVIQLLAKEIEKLKKIAKRGSESNERENKKSFQRQLSNVL